MENSVRYYRTKKGLTQQQVADLLDMHVTNYNKIENGRSDPEVSRFHQIATVLGTTASALLAAPPPDSLNDMEARRHEMFSLYDELDDTDRDGLLRIARGYRDGAQPETMSNSEEPAVPSRKEAAKGRKARSSGGR